MKKYLKWGCLFAIVALLCGCGVVLSMHEKSASQKKQEKVQSEEVKKTKEESAPSESEKEVEVEEPESSNPEETEEELTEPANEETAEELVYPLTYQDNSCNITVYKENYAGSTVYGAHVQLSDYSRFFGEYLGGQVLSSVASDKILAINGDWASPNGYTEIRNGRVIVQSNVPEGAYSASNGRLWYAQNGYGGATETFCFGPAFLINGSVIGNGGGSGAQRTFIGTNGTPGDLWLCVSDGRYVDGTSAGLTQLQSAQYLQSKGCTFGVPLDGGGSSEMIFQGHILNAIDSERPLNDALYIQ